MEKELNKYQKFIIYWDYHITNMCLEILHKRKDGFYHYNSFDEFTDEMAKDWLWKFKERINIENK